MIIAIVGTIGSGKTLWMTRCLYKEKMRSLDSRICANYGLSFDHEKINGEELFGLKSSLKNTILGIDEMHIFMDSRDFMKPNNKQMTHFILQTRHLGVQLYFTTQDISQVDVRLRRQLDYLIHCTKTEIKDYFRVKIVDYTDILNIRLNAFVYHGSPYYELYDTTEIVDIMGEN